jgi:hypothetical protein
LSISYQLHIPREAIFAVQFRAMRPCETLIICALLPEAKAVARACGIDPGKDGFKQNLLYTPKIAIGLVGPRAAKLPRIATNVAPQRVIVAGLAGGLSPKLKVGDVVFLSAKNRIYTSTKVVGTVAEKGALFIATGCVAVDMETDIVRQYAATIGVPFTSIRAISDSSAEELDPEILNLVDADGKPRIKEALKLMFFFPEKIAVLWRLNRATKLALGNLGSGVRSWLGGTGKKPRKLMGEEEEDAAKGRRGDAESDGELDE